MAVEAAVSRLVEAALESGLTPEQVCGDSPDLLPAVRARWERCRRVEAALDDLFPPSGEGLPAASYPGRRRLFAGTGDGDGDGDGDAQLPQVPGYEVEAVLGRGGMGVVYRARDVRLRRPVALKMLLSGQHAGRGERARFRREAQAVAALRHPHVVAVYDVGEHAGLAYFTMELVEGGTLAARLAGAPLPPADAAALLGPLAAAVAAAHAAGVVHRDLKPGNVLLGPDGAPKVGDFGLARWSGGGGGGGGGGGDDEPPLTLSGARVGTPSYMAPEQVRGDPAAVGPAADVYGLGAVLYEMLTGRPPFRGDSPAETVRQLLADEPVPPSRLNRRVPRDLETICLTCLHKLPARRYASAAAVGEDVRRFRAGEPIAARRTGPAERAAKWVRRRPAVATAAAATVVVALTLGGGGLWLASGRAVRLHAADNELRDAVQFQRRSEWTAANAALDRAAIHLGDAGGPAALRARFDRARRDAALVPRLDRIRLARASSTRGFLDSERAAADYAAAFRDAGLGDPSDPPAVVGARVRASNVHRPLMSALADWARCWDATREWALAAEAAADPEPSGWRARARDPATWRDPSELDALVAEPEALRQPVDLLLAVADQMIGAGRDPLPLLARVQKAHPADFWANYMLGSNLAYRGRAADSLPYLQTAVALRPDAATVHYSVGVALWKTGRTEAAIAALGESLRLDSESHPTLHQLGVALADAGRREEAVDALRRAARRNPRDARTQAVLGHNLAALGRDADAVAAYELSVAADPTVYDVQTALRTTLFRLGRAEDVLAAWRAALAANPRDAYQWYGYAEYCLFLDRPADYAAAAAQALDRFGTNPDPRACERAGRAVLLTPVTGDRLAAATAAVDRAVASQRANRTYLYKYFMFAKALAEYRNDRPQAALDVVAGEAGTVLGPAPQLVVAMARARLGRPEAARAALAAAVLAFDWAPAAATYPDAWMYHVLRREAEQVVLPDLRAFLTDGRPVTDADERVALTGVCHATGRYAAEARLWAETFRFDDERAVQHRRVAARAAALAGAGIGADAASQRSDDRARWRRRAYEWVLPEVAAIEADAARPGHSWAMYAARSAADVAGKLSVLRDPARVAQMAAGERAEWQAVFARLDAVARAATPPP